MTDTARIDALEMAVGIPRATATRLSQKEWEALKPWPSVVSGDYNLFDWLRLNSQLVAEQKGMIDALTARVAALEAKPAATTTTPVASNPVVTPTTYPIGAYGLPIRPLTNGEQRNTIDALVRGGYEGAPTVELDFTKGVYPVQDAAVIDRVKEIFYRDTTPQTDKDALKILLSAIDQRNMQTNALLPLSEAIPISGTLGATATTGNPVSTPASTPVVYADSIVMVNPETGFTNWITTSQNDDGLRIDYNTKYPWQGGAPSNPKLPQIFVFIERNGGVSINGNAPLQDADGNPIPKGPWDGLGGKDFEVFPLGFDRGDSKGKSQHVDIACLQAGRILRLGASRETAKPIFHLEITPDGVNQT